jgi:hypothetical protein
MATPPVRRSRFPIIQIEGCTASESKKGRSPTRPPSFQISDRLILEGEPEITLAMFQNRGFVGFFSG